LKQVLITGLFHADPHPGNVLVLPGNVVAFVDFGIVGRVRGPLRQQLTEVILAIAQRDAERIADIVVHVATPLEPVNMAALSSDIDDMIDTYAGLTLGELPLGEVLSAVTTAMSRHRLKMPADLLLLIKTVTTIEGVGRTLDPSFQMVEYASPLVQQLVAEQHTPAALALRGARAGRDVMAALRALPADVAELAQRTRRDGLRVQFVHRNLEHFTLEMDRASNRLSFANIIAAIVIGSSVMVHAAIGPTAFGYPLLGVLGFVVAGVLGLGLAVGILRSGRL
jgi:ubiquinone biosynthesis protein